MAALKAKVDLDEKTNVSCGMGVKVYSWSGSQRVIVGGTV